MHAVIRALLVSLLLVGTAQAADYYWESRDGKLHDISPATLCSSLFGNPEYNGVYDAADAPLRVADDHFVCRGHHSDSNDGNAYGYAHVYRSGNACAANTEFNSETGACDAQTKCSALKDQNFAWGYKTPVGYVTNGGKHGIGGYINKDGCEADPGTFNCDAASDGSDYGYCKGIGTYTGLNASTGDTNVGATAIGNDPGKGENTNCGTGMVWSGTTCVKDPNATTDTGTGGDTGGGTGTETGTGSDSSGGGSSGGGSSGGGSTGGSGSGDGTGTGTGDGTGSGTGTGTDGDDDDDDGKTDSKVSGEACTASLSCQGDAIQCAILRQQRMQQCQTAEWNDYSKAKDTISSAVAGKEYELQESKVDVSSGFDTGTRFLGSTCPTPKSYHSNSFGRTFELDYAPACQYASAISYLVLAMASLFFIVYVGRSFGGD